MGIALEGRGRSGHHASTKLSTLFSTARNRRTTRLAVVGRPFLGDQFLDVVVVGRPFLDCSQTSF